MLPIYLSLEGFKSFKKRCVIDFGYLAEYEIFGVAGSTGSGKSSILSGILYALFGAVKKNDNDNLLNLKSSHLVVEFRFKMDGHLYRVARSARRLASGAFNKSAALEEMLEDGSCVPLAERKDTAVTQKIQEIIGLDFKDLTQVCFLEQGEYDKFLSLQNAERIDTIVRIFKLERYGERLMNRVKERLYDVENKMSLIKARIDEYGEATKERLAAHQEIGKGLAAQFEGQNAAYLEGGARLGKMKEDFDRYARRQRLEIELKQNEKTEKEAKVESERAERSVVESEKTFLDLDVECVDKKKLFDILSKRAENRAKRARLEGEKKGKEQLAFASVKSIAALEGELAVAESECNKIRTRYQDEERRDLARGLRLRLKEDDECPVCGGRVNKSDELLNDEGLLLVLKEELERGQRRCEELRTKIANARTVNLTATTEIASLLKQLDELELELKGQDEGESVGEMDVDKLKEELAQRTAQRLKAEKDLKEQRGQLERAKSQLALALGRQAQITKELSLIKDAPKVEKAELDDLSERQATLYKALFALNADIAKNNGQIEIIKKGIELKKQYESQREKLKGEATLLAELFGLVKNRRFIAYIAEEKLQRITARAGERLLELTDGRLELLYQNQSFVARDNFNEGKTRAVSTLSGGETFLTSLSLALSISDEIARERKLGFLFLDEGFGTLDAELIDTVIGALETLKKQNTVIGVISHRAELMQRLPFKLSVVKDSEGSKII